MSIEFVQDQVRIESLRVVSEHSEFTIDCQFPQPIEEILNASGAFEMKEVIAVGGGSAYPIGYMDARVLHGLTVPVDEEVVFGLDALRTIGLAFSGF